MKKLSLNPHSSISILPCKICKGNSLLYGEVDFNKNCEVNKSNFLELAGIPIDYHRCEQCGLLFTVAFDHWSKADFLEHIYNDDYKYVDPEYEIIRPSRHAALLIETYKKFNVTKFFDYGCGNGALTKLLVEEGCEAKGWDPMNTSGELPPNDQFNIVSAFEVLEHSPTPVETFGEALSFLKPGGIFFFTTLMIKFSPLPSLDDWYVAPRNGHVTIYTSKSLHILAQQYGCLIQHGNEGTHIAYREKK